MIRNNQSKKALIFLGFFFFLGFITILGISWANYNTFNYPNDYAIVIDAGSSGSRTYVYSWKSGLSAYKGDNIRVEELSECTKNPGIDKLNSKNDVILYFYDCLQKSSKLIPNDRKDRAYIILAATAGMRLLDITNRNQSEKILSLIREHFSESEFLFKSKDQVKIIDGKDEGLYGWISANYFAEKFSKKSDPETTIGTLDLGGASTQIAFLPSVQRENSSVTNQFFEKLRIYGSDYRTYSSSFLCWGTNQIILVYQTYLIIKNGYKPQINASCFNLQKTIEISVSSILNSPCANGDIFKYSPNIDLTKLKEQSVYVFNGNSDPDKCEEELQVLFPNKTCSYGKCTFNDIYLPSISSKNKFYAFSSYYYQMANSEQLSNKILRKNFPEYVSETKKLCSLDYNELTEINNKLKVPISEEYLQTICFYNLYISKLLPKFQINNFDNVEIGNKINGYTIGWTLGYMIDLINREDFLPQETPKRNLDKGIFVPVIIICVLFALVAFISGLSSFIYL
ncbi:unnamed protein product [Brachionus calyciflorus]|uniref:Ectonucleoside triphosphate diphosphohydrolase 1 n=1 Tax=Brachionus calyciflorus TaxID=104777 RepID=A0A813PII1_9BILA|nr:unnamed protein product [Brachionus calyciflorus]